MKELAVDLLVIGGGITGAGIALEAARRGVDVMLVEAHDFAWGTSSRSSKLVHGGLRYLRQGAFGLVRESVRERNRLLHDAGGLVEAQRAFFGHYEGRSPSRRSMAAGLALYDAFGHARTRASHTRAEALGLAPHVAADGLLGASTYLDAKTDDARLVLRVLQEAEQHGARTVNGAVVRSLVRAGDGGGRGEAVVGARIEGAGFSGVVRARCVVNATGVWADALRSGLGAAPMLRPLRGSHLLFPLWRLPVAQSVGLLHPRDRRPVFATPWEGAALVGTTDLDHRQDLAVEPSITAEEVAYLLEALAHAFPALRLTAADAISSFAGVRPVVDDGAADPSRASREHVVRSEHGLVTVTGGKLTTFRPIALAALAEAGKRLPALRGIDAARALAEAPILDAVEAGPVVARLPPAQRTRLLGRHGRRADALVAEAGTGKLDTVPGTSTLWAELSWALRHEQVRHLDDLLLRRTRLGLLLRDGAAALLPRLRPIACEALSWSGEDWRAECARYSGIIAHRYSVPRP